MSTAEIVFQSAAIDILLPAINLSCLLFQIYFYQVVTNDTSVPHSAAVLLS